VVHRRMEESPLGESRLENVRRQRTLHPVTWTFMSLLLASLDLMFGIVYLEGSVRCTVWKAGLVNHMPLSWVVVLILSRIGCYMSVHGELLEFPFVPL
jgi:hypothetical protein